MLSISLAVGQIQPDELSVPTSASAVLPTFEGTLEISSDRDPVEISVSSPASYAGTYFITQADIETGPVNLVPAQLDGIAPIGQPVDHTSGLWVYDALKQGPITTLQWLRDGVDIPGATGASHIVQPADAGMVLSLRETVSQPGGGTTAQLSGGVAIPDITSGRTLVFSLIGQSNMVGFAPFDGGDPYPVNTLQVARSGRHSGGTNGQVIAAQTALDHHDGASTYMGLAVQFAIDHMAANPEDTVLFVPDAKGTTGFAGAQWSKGGFYYNSAVTRVNTVMAENPSFEFGGFLWQQGESDAGSAADAAAYATALDTMIADLRADVSTATADTPFVLGGMMPSWVAADANRQTVQAALADTPNRVASTAFVDSAGLSPLPDGIHFDAPSLRSLGARYFTVLEALNLSGPSVSEWDIAGTVIQSAQTSPAFSVSGTVISEGL